MRLAFPGLQAEARSGDTVLTGALADPAALYGVLAELEALGLELLEVRGEVGWLARSRLPRGLRSYPTIASIPSVVTLPAAARMALGLASMPVSGAAV